jgi:adenylate cyclase
LLAEFGSAVEAVSCAVAVQQELSNRTQGEDLKVRIGIHLGDVVDKAGDLFGTAVNVAARLEGIAQPGGIVVSAAVRDAIAGKLATSFADLGLQALKNIEEPVKTKVTDALRLAWERIRRRAGCPDLHFRTPMAIGTAPDYPPGASR